MIRKSAWLLSAGVFAVATPAFAQTANSTTDTDKQTAQPTPGAAEGAAAQDQAGEEQPIDTSDIVITATRRNQALSDVPMAVSAVTAENLRNSGATDIRQLNQLAPSLLVSSTSSEGGAAVARIRGVGTVGDNPGLEASVGIFIDGVYRSRASMGLTELGPLDRIEVLRGPQGTLFGRNTSAGLISIITAKPRFSPEVSGQVDIGNYSERRVEASITGPLSDTIAARLDAVWLKRDGFLEDVISGRDVNNRDRWMTRGQLLFQPSDNFSFRLIGDYTKRNEECCAATYLPAHDVIATGGGNTALAPSTIAAIERGMGAIINDDTFDRKVSITPGRSYRSDVTDWGISGEGVYDMGWGELTSITAYRYNKYTRGQDADFNNLDILYRDDDGSAFNKFRTFTQELRLQGNTFNNRLDWLVGGYYANEKLQLLDNLAYGQDYAKYSNCPTATGSPSRLHGSSPMPARSPKRKRASVSRTPMSSSRTIPKAARRGSACSPQTARASSIVSARALPRPARASSMRGSTRPVTAWPSTTFSSSTAAASPIRSGGSAAALRARWSRLSRAPRRRRCLRPNRRAEPRLSRSRPRLRSPSAHRAERRWSK
jgi:outer membrane receptor protein involved in Fe transport